MNYVTRAGGRKDSSVASCRGARPLACRRSIRAAVVNRESSADINLPKRDERRLHERDWKFSPSERSLSSKVPRGSYYVRFNSEEKEKTGVFNRLAETS